MLDLLDYEEGDGNDPNDVRDWLSDRNGFLEFSPAEERLVGVHSGPVDTCGSLWRYEKQMDIKWLKVPFTFWPGRVQVRDHRYIIFEIAGRKVEIDAVDNRSGYLLTIVHLDSELVGLTMGNWYQDGGTSSYFTSVEVGDKLLHISDPSVVDPDCEFKLPTIRVLSRVNKSEPGIIPKKRKLKSDRIIGKDGKWQDELRNFFLPKTLLSPEIFDECEEKGWPLLKPNGTIIRSWDGNPRDIRRKQFGEKNGRDEVSDYSHGAITKNPASRSYTADDVKCFRRLEDETRSTVFKWERLDEASGEPFFQTNLPIGRWILSLMRQMKR